MIVKNRTSWFFVCLIGLVFYTSFVNFFGVQVFAASETITCDGASRTLSVGAYTDSAGSQFSSGADLILNAGSGNCTFTISGTSEIILGSLTIATGVTLTHANNTTAQSNILNISAGTITIDSGASIDVDGRGYRGNSSSGSGPGGGTFSAGGYGGGGSHAGDAGSGANNILGGTAYCSITDINTIGSGGAGGSGAAGGNGGGLIKLTATETITINGALTADGGPRVGANAAGGGGGGINITADIIAGTPTSFTANGSDGSTAWSGGGGGGCISLTYTTSNSISVSAITAQSGTGRNKGGAGLILIQDTDGTSILHVKNNSVGVNTPQVDSAISVDTISIINSTYSVGSSKSLTVGGDPYEVSNGILTISGTLNQNNTSTFENINVSIASGGILNMTNTTDLVVASNASLTLASDVTINTANGTALESIHSSGTLTLSAGGIFSVSDLIVAGGTTDLSNYTINTPLILDTLTVQSGGILTHSANATTQAHIIHVVANDIDIQSGGSINVDGKGYAPGGINGTGFGPGGGIAINNLGPGGAGHGGAGGNGESGFGGPVYCDISNVSTIGSGGGGGGGTPGSGYGGGLIKLKSLGSMHISGIISANGTRVAGHSYRSGGAGGGINLTASTITGTPSTISVRGGDGNNFAGAGGGGCISIMFGSTNSITSSTPTLSVDGGVAPNAAFNGGVGTFTSILSNTAPVATISIASQASASVVTVTSTVSDIDNNITTLAVEYSTDGSIWNNATLGNVTDTEGQGGVTTSTGLISGIDTNNDGSVDLTIEWNVAADISGIDDDTVYLRITPNDGSVDGDTVSTAAFPVDTEAPIITNIGIISITTDNGVEGVAGIGDGLTLTGVTTTIDDGHVITIDFGTVGGDNDVLMGTEGFVGSGAIDGMTTFTIRVTDDIGNVSVTTSEAVNIDNQAPTFDNIGTVIISTDGGTPNIAGIGDGLTLTGATTTVADGDLITIDFSPAGGFVGVAMDMESILTAGDLDATTTFMITATDNAGNIATTTSNVVSIDNVAPTAATGGFITIVDDVHGNGIAAVGDRVKYTEGALGEPDTVTWTIDLSALTGQAALVAGVTSTEIVAGSLDNATQTFIVTLTDDAGNTATTTSGILNVDNEMPEIVDNGTVTITTDNGVADVAGIGDGLTLTGVTTTVDDGDVVTIYYGVVGGNDDTLMGAEGFVGSGSVDGDTSFVIYVTDNAGNTVTTTSNMVSVDNQAPTFANIGTVIISTDNGVEGVAGIRDGLTLTGATTTVSDGDVIVIDFSPVGGFFGVAMDTEGVVHPGSVDATTTFVITATDNAGNLTTTTSNGVLVDNEAPVATTGGIIMIVDDVYGNGIAVVGDRVQYTVGDLLEPDTVTWTIDLSALTGQSALVAGVTSTVVTTGTLDNTTQTFVVTLTDDAGNTATTTSGVLNVDNQMPVITNSGAVAITKDGGVVGIAGVGDGLTLSGVTVQADDGDMVTVDFAVAGGLDNKLMGQEDLLGAGAMDGDISFIIYVTDNAGNTVTTTSNIVSVDNQAPTFTNNGTFTITTDSDGNAVANIDDGVTLAGVTLGEADGDTITVDLLSIAGNASVSMGAEATIIAGLISSSAYTAVITATDDAGNTATTSTNAIAVNNIAPEEAGGDGDESSSRGSAPFIPPSQPVVDADIDETAAFSLNSGAATTNNRTVQAIFTGISNATQVALSNTLDFSGVSFIPFTPSMSHVLSAENGLKTVYAKLRSAAGGLRTFTDTILLTEQPTNQDTSPEAATDCPLPIQIALKTPDSSAIYYITEQCTKRGFSSSELYFTYFSSWSEVQITTQTLLSSIPNDTIGFLPLGPRYTPTSGALVKTLDNPKTYLLLQGTLYHIENEAAAEFQFGTAWATWIEGVDERLLKNYPLSSIKLNTIERLNGILIKYPNDPKVYQLAIQNGVQVKRWIPTEDAFRSLNFRDDRIVTVPSTEVYLDGSDLTE